MDKFSTLIPISISKATANLSIGSDLLDVYPMELLPFTDGEVTNLSSRIEATGVDAYGRTYATASYLSNSIRAKWLRGGGNRATPENIRRGQRVMLYQLADDPEAYYWTYMGLDDHLFRKETVTTRYSNTDDESTKELTSDNTVWVEVSTHLKTLTLHTPTNDGEPCTFDVQLDYGAGKLAIVDGVGNSLNWDATNRSIKVTNKDTTSIHLNRKDLLVTAPDNITLDTKTFTVNGKTINLNAAVGKFDIKTLTLDGAMLTVNHIATFTKEVTVIGILTGAANLVIGGAAAIAGALAAMGAAMTMDSGGLSMATDVNIDGELTNNGVDVGSTHKHTTPGGLGPGETTTPH